MNKSEIWKSIPGHEGYYEASNLGRVRSVDRIVKRIRHDGISSPFKLKGKILAQGPVGEGYLGVNLRIDGISTLRYVHQIILKTFTGEPCPGQEVMHLDGIKTNNNLSNLRYGSRSCNHAFKNEHGTATKNENHPMAKLSFKDVMLIRMYYHFEGLSAKKLAKKFNVATMTAYRAATKKSWR